MSLWYNRRWLGFSEIKQVTEALQQRQSGPRQWSLDDGWVYAAQEVDAPLIKIGGTGRPLDSRLKVLKAQYKTHFVLIGCVYVPCRCVFIVEHLIHKALTPSRIQGEWFYLHLNQHVLETLAAAVFAAYLVQLREELRQSRLARCKELVRELEEVA
jgi:T5orf172 domain